MPPRDDPVATATGIAAMVPRLHALLPGVDQNLSTRGLPRHRLDIMESQLEQQLRIRQLVENWAVWRDAGDWERFRTVWHDDGVMMATWFQGPFEEFIRVTIEGWNKGVSILHFLGGSSIDVQGTRAIAQTKMTISQRGMVEDVLCDVVCTGRFYDFFEERHGRWGLVHRQPIYEKDRIDPVRASDTRSRWTCPCSRERACRTCIAEAPTGSLANPWSVESCRSFINRICLTNPASCSRATRA